MINVLTNLLQEHTYQATGTFDILKIFIDSRLETRHFLQLLFIEYIW